MLVLSRKRDDVILIGDDVRITVVKIDRNSVRLGIEAPGSTSILRQELLLDAEEFASKLEWEVAKA
jgi:carbon storage regulator